MNEADLKSRIADHDGRADVSLQRNIRLAALPVGRTDLHIDGVRAGSQGLEAPVGRALRLRREELRAGLAIADRHRLPEAHRRIHLHYPQPGRSADGRRDRVDDDGRAGRCVVPDVQQHAEKLMQDAEPGGDDQRRGHHDGAAARRVSFAAASLHGCAGAETLLHHERHHGRRLEPRW